MLLGLAMWYSKNFSARVSIYCSLPRLLAAIAIAGLFSQLSLAEPDLIDSDLGLPHSAPNKTLIAPEAISPRQATPKISPAEAAELVRRKVGGQVMSVNSRTSDAGIIYGVKVLNADRMRTIHVDAQTGRLLNP